MSRYDGLIIPRSYSEYINKTDAATLSQALALPGVMDAAPTEDSTKAVKSGGVFNALAGKQPTLTFDNEPTVNSNNPVKSSGLVPVDEVTSNNMRSVTSNAVAKYTKSVKVKTLSGTTDSNAIITPNLSDSTDKIIIGVSITNYDNAIVYTSSYNNVPFIHIRDIVGNYLTNANLTYKIAYI